MDRLARILSSGGLVVAFLMRVAGLVTAVDLLLLHPNQAGSLQLLLSGLLLLGGQATKDLLLGLVDRLMAGSGSHHASEPEDRKRGG